MPRRRINPEVHAVDETEDTENKYAPYIRLEPNSDLSDAKEIVKLEAQANSGSTEKLLVPVRDDIETRSNQPGVETLIDAERALLAGPEENWGKANEEKRPVPWGWFALIGLLILSVSAWALWDIVFAQEKIEVIRIETEEILSTEDKSVETAMSLVRSIETTIQSFAAARNVEEMERYVRHPKRVRALMEDHYSRVPFAPIGSIKIESLNPLTLGNRGDFWLAIVATNTGRSLRMIVQAGPETATQIDWETFVNYQPMNWDDYATQRPKGTAMDFRVYLTPDTLFSHEFQNSNEWDCYMLTALDSDDIQFGYVKKDSSSAKMMRRWFMQHPNQKASMILRLSIPEGLTSPRGVVIDHARSVRWIYIVSPDGDS